MKTRYTLHVVFLFLLFWSFQSVYAQVGIGTTTPNPKSILELKATDKGFLMPRMSLAQRTALGAGLTPTDMGMMVLDTSATDAGLYLWDGSQWVDIASGPWAWNGGNVTLQNDLDLVGIGTSTPNYKLEITNGHLAITNNNDIAGRLYFLEPSSGGLNYTSFRASSQTADINYFLPPAIVAGGYLSTDAAGNLSWASVPASQWTTTGSDIYYNTGGVGIGTTTPFSNSHLSVVGNRDRTIRADNTATAGVTTAIYGTSVNTSGNSSAIRGEAQAASGQTYGVYGLNNSTNTTAAGVAGETSTAGYGVYGYNTSNTGSGVYGRHSGVGAGIGVSGVTTSNANNASGVRGDAANGSTNATYGVLGLTSSTNASAAGVRGETPSGGIGVFGLNGSNQAFSSGVRAEHVGENASGVYGLYAWVGSTSANSAAVIAVNGNAGYAGRFDGRLAAGSGQQFQVATDGNLNLLRNVNYLWPNANGTGVLTNDGAGNLTWAPAGGSSQWTTTGSDIYYDLGNVGIGTITPSAPLDVVGSINTNADYRINNNTVLAIHIPNRNLNVGKGAAPGITSGQDNVVMGDGAGNILSTGGQNVIIGSAAGQSNSSGGSNVLVGSAAGLNNNGSANVIVGASAGLLNTAGSANVFVGNSAGYFATSGGNVLVGANAGLNMTSGAANTVVGNSAGQNLATGASNAIYGANAGLNTTGSSNTLIGESSGTGTTTGFANTFVGQNSGFNNTTGYENTFIGTQSGVGATQVFRATAIGYGAIADTNNAVILGNAVANVGMGTSKPTHKLHVVGSMRLVDGTQQTGYVLTSDANGVASWQAPGSTTEWTRATNYVRTQNITDSVAIGVPTTTARFEVYDGAAKGFFRLFEGSDDIHVDGGSNGVFAINNSSAVGGAGVRFKTGSTQIMAINNSGNVGIGTITPGASLDIQPATAAALALRPYGTSPGETGEIRFYELVANGTDYVAFKADNSITAPTTFILPANYGVANQVLTTDGAGKLTWNTVAGDNLGNHSATANLKMNNLYISNDGDNEGVVVEANGNVGVGTTIFNNPARFNVLTSSAATQEMVVATSSGANATTIDFSTSGIYTVNATIGLSGTTEKVVPNSASNDFVISAPNSNIQLAAANFKALMFGDGTGGQDLLVLDNNSDVANFPLKKVGIGTSTPQAVLDVQGEVKLGNTAVAATGANAGALRWNGSAVQYSDGATWQNLGLSGGGTNYLARWTGSSSLGIGTTQDDGNQVGIGTAPTAAQRLAVSGTGSHTYAIQANMLNTAASSAAIVGNHSAGSTNAVYGVVGTTNSTAFNAAGVYALSNSASTALMANSNATGYIFRGRSTGADKVVIDNNGNMGIGTSAPAQPLHVVGSARISSLVSGAAGGMITSNGNGDLFVSDFTGLATDVLRGDGTFGAAPGGLSGGTANYVARWTSGTSIGVGALQDDGNTLAIGTAPVGTAELTIAGDEIEASTANEDLLHFNTSDGHVGSVYRDNNGSSNYLGIESHNVGNTVKTPLVLQEFGGNVGIGTATPAAKLHVVGGEVIVGNSGLPAGPTNAGAIRWAGTQLQYSDGTTWQTISAASGDNLGNHTLGMNLVLNDYIISNDGSANGLRLNNDGQSGLNSPANTDNSLQVYRTTNAFGANKANIYAYRDGSNNATDGGTGYGQTGIDAAIKGYSFWGNNYTAGVAGYNFLDYNHSSGVLGANQDGSIYAALAHRDVNGFQWSLYANGNSSILGQLKNLTDPSDPQDAVTLSYLDNNAIKNQNTSVQVGKYRIDGSSAVGALSINEPSFQVPGGNTKLAVHGGSLVYNEGVATTYARTNDGGAAVVGHAKNDITASFATGHWATGSLGNFEDTPLTPGFDPSDIGVLGYTGPGLNPFGGFFANTSSYLGSGQLDLSSAPRYVALAGNTYAGLFMGGNVGIGTSTPSTPLEVQTAGNVYGIQQTDGSITVGTFIGGAINGGYLGTRSNHPLGFYTNDGGAQLYLATNGRTAVGHTNTPDVMLDVEGGVLVDRSGNNNGTFDPHTTLSFGSGDEGISSQRSGGGNLYGLDLYTAGVRRMSVANGGNVAIGTTTFDHKLVVDAQGATDPLIIRSNGSGYLRMVAGGKVGIGSYFTPMNPLDVDGGMVLGNTYKGSAVAPANSMLIEGQLGIGTAAPNAGAKLHVYQPTGPTQIRLESDNNSPDIIIDGYSPAAADGSQNSTIEFHENGAFRGSMGWDAFQDVFFVYNYDNPAGIPTLITKQGNVGIGTANPMVPLEIVRNGTYSENHILTYTTGAEYSALVLGKSRGTVTVPAATTAGDVLGALIFRGRHGTGWQTAASQIRADAAENMTGTAGGSSIIFSTVSNGTNVSQERMRINHNGNIGIGVGIPGFPLDVFTSVAAGNINSLFINSGATDVAVPTSNVAGVSVSVRASGAFWSTGIGAGGGFYASSDQRIKRIVGQSNSTEDLATLMKLRVTDYSFVDSIGHGRDKVKGVIAQQVKEVYPQAVSLQTGVLPDIYKLAAVAAYDSTLQQLTLALPADYQLKAGDKVRLITEKTQGEFPVINANGKAVTVGNWTQPATQVFVYGREVEDFHTVDYDRLHTLSISAVQELARRNEALTREVEDLKAELNRSGSDNEQLRQHLQQMLGRLEAVESRLNLEAQR